jgi:muramoyltetrapeptide carboxypeptidase
MKKNIEQESVEKAARSPLSVTLFTPAGALQKAAPLRLATKRLKAAGCAVHVDEAALVRQQRFAGDDASRVAAFYRVAKDGSEVALATRGGYGMSRILDALDYKKLAKSGKKWVGMSDMTAFSLAMLAKAGAVTYSGPLACDQFARDEEDATTMDCFLEAMRGELEAIGFATKPALAKSIDVKGTLWGGNLKMVTCMLGTPYWPAVKGGILFLEDVGEHPYKIERMLLQLKQAGVLDAQKAVLLGHFTGFKTMPNDRGYRLQTCIDYLRTQTKTPILTGLPVGHVATVVTLPVGAKARLLAEGKDAFLVFE